MLFSLDAQVAGHGREQRNTENLLELFGHLEDGALLHMRRLCVFFLLMP
jgi:hypothetical protein